MILISACLAGDECRYDGTGFMYGDLKRLVDAGEAIKVCPELLGGMSTPRNPCEIIHKDGSVCVMDSKGNDYTHEFELGASKTLELCMKYKIDKAILKSRSPSCGYGKIYSGCFDGILLDGNGLTAEVLLRNGIEIFTELDYFDSVRVNVNE
jgi:uncharacterized protein YbbK (DUF523 family)